MIHECCRRKSVEVDEADIARTSRMKQTNELVIRENLPGNLMIYIMSFSKLLLFWKHWSHNFVSNIIQNDCHSYIVIDTQSRLNLHSLTNQNWYIKFQMLSVLIPDWSSMQNGLQKMKLTWHCLWKQTCVTLIDLDYISYD